MDTVGQPPVAKIQPSTRPSAARRWIVLAIVILVLGLVWYWYAAANKRQPSTGIAGRAVPVVETLNNFVGTKGACFEGYILQPAGRSSRGQHYAVTMSLQADVSDQSALVTHLTTDSCTTEMAAIKTTVAPLINADTTPNILTVHFVTKSGKRIQLP